MMHSCLMMRTDDQRGCFRLMMRLMILTRDRWLNDQNHIEVDGLMAVNDLLDYYFRMENLKSLENYLYF